MKVFINPGHSRAYDSGAVNPENGMREADVAYSVGELLCNYLNAAGVGTDFLQSDNLLHDSDHEEEPCVVDEANASGADLFISLHCNAAGGDAAGTETLVYADDGGAAAVLARCVQSQIVSSLGTVNRGIKERTGLIVLRHVDAPAVLVEMAFIDNGEDAELLADRQDDFARAIARGVTDYEQQQAI